MTSIKKDSASTSDQMLIKAAEIQNQATTLDVTKTDSIRPTASTKLTDLRLEETTAALTDVNFKPTTEPTPTIAVKDLLALPLLRFPLKSLNKPQPSTFIPTTQNIFKLFISWTHLLPRIPTLVILASPGIHSSHHYTLRFLHSSILLT